MADNFAKKKSFLTIFFNSKTYLNKTELSLLLKAYNLFQIKYMSESRVASNLPWLLSESSIWRLISHWFHRAFYSSIKFSRKTYLNKYICITPFILKLQQKIKPVHFHNAL